jgi:hypothetical protein
MSMTTSLDRTNDLALAAFLVASGVKLRGVEGPPGRRIFLFSQEVPATRLAEFYGSPEKRVLDTFRSLKALAQSS